MGRKVGAAVPLSAGETPPPVTPYQVAHFDPSNHLATIHQRYRQTEQTGQRSRSIRQTVTCNGRPKSPT